MKNAAAIFVWEDRITNKCFTFCTFSSSSSLMRFTEFNRALFGVCSTMKDMMTVQHFVSTSFKKKVALSKMYNHLNYNSKELTEYYNTFWHSLEIVLGVIVSCTMLLLSSFQCPVKSQFSVQD